MATDTLSYAKTMFLDRFLSVADHFVDELAPVSSGLVPRDGDPKFEHLVAGLRSIEIKVSCVFTTTAI